MIDPNGRFARDRMTLLIVEDDDDFAELVGALLIDNPETEFQTKRVATLAEARELLTPDVDAILLDLGLPDSSGLRTVREIVDGAEGAAVVILTAIVDQHLAQKSLELGAQEFLVKTDINAPLLTRTLRYAVERQRLMNQLRESRASEAREHELRRLERLSTDQRPQATAAQYGSGPLHERAPDRAIAAMHEYGKILDRALEDRAFRGSEDVRDDLRSLAQILGFLGATPRDVVRLHASILRDRIAATNYDRAQAYVEEGRVHVLELMGYVASYYRARAIGHFTPSTKVSETP